MHLFPGIVSRLSCKWQDNESVSYANDLVFSLSICSLLVITWQICQVEHGTQQINFLTMRPWRVSLVIVIFVAVKVVSNEVYISWDFWLFIERICKLLNIFFGLTLAFEKQILSIFMIYQAHFPLNQHDVMKDNLRDLEQRINRRYWVQLTAITIFILSTCIFTAIIQDESKIF